MATLKLEVDNVSLNVDDRVRTLDDVLKQMLRTAGRLVEESWRQHTVGFGHYLQKSSSKGDMYKNIEAADGKRKTDAYRSVQIYPRRSITRKLRGGRTQTVTNAQKAFYLNYGTVVRGKTHVLADHWVEWTRNDSDPEALAEMERIWEKYNQKYS